MAGSGVTLGFDPTRGDASIRDVDTPFLWGAAAEMGSVTYITAELARRAEEADRELVRLRWEAAWARLTGRPWRWRPRVPTIEVTLNASHAMLSIVAVDGAPLPCYGVSVSADVVDGPRVRFELPLDMVRLTVAPAA